MNNSSGYTVSSGNVFADLGHPNPEEALLKAQLAYRIRAIIQDRGLTQAQAADLLGIDQPKVSLLMRGRLSGFSVDRLFRYLTALGQKVEITVKSAGFVPKGAVVEVRDSASRWRRLTHRSRRRTTPERSRALLSSQDDASSTERLARDLTGLVEDSPSKSDNYGHLESTTPRVQPAPTPQYFQEKRVAVSPTRDRLYGLLFEKRVSAQPEMMTQIVQRIAQTGVMEMVVLNENVQRDWLSGNANLASTSGSFVVNAYNPLMVDQRGSGIASSINQQVRMVNQVEIA